MRILYAEDERGLSEAVVDILVYHNYAVDAVYDGETALAYIGILPAALLYDLQNGKTA